MDYFFGFVDLLGIEFGFEKSFFFEEFFIGICLLVGLFGVLFFDIIGFLEVMLF